MSEVNGRLWAIGEVLSRQIRSLPELAMGSKVVETFGCNTFDVSAMKEKLPKPVFQSLQATIRSGSKLDPAIANEVAHAVKEWALSKGVTHFCHWFQPQTGLTAEKHDAFLTFDDDERPVARFSGAQLIQSEPDASSFPSGGMRTTFEARGYTAWDPSSPIFVMDGPNGKTLCVPSVFISYHGDALDNKTPLLRSMEVPVRARAGRAAAVRRARGQARGADAGPGAGVLPHRPCVLRCSGPTSWPPAAPSSAPSRRRARSWRTTTSAASRTACWPSCRRRRYELFKLGIPIKTRHNEVAPSQYETAPIFEEANVASDHNQMVMETMRARGAAPRPRPPAAREAVRGDQRQRQALQLVAHGLRGPQPARARAPRRSATSSSWCC